jgi:two-component system cell cycle response regulator
VQGRILVADDSTAVRSILRKRLVLAGYDVIEAANGEQAVQLVRAVRPDLVLLDVEMPVLDGFQVMAVLRTDEAVRDVPVIFLTARVDTNELVEGLDLGAFDYVKKPCDVGELVARVRAGVRWKARADELRRMADEGDSLGSTDALTGLPNRRALERRMTHLVEEGRRDSIVVALVDVDHFKRVNDEHGHPAGDAVLRTVAHRLRSAARPGQVIGRWGGEEFLALSPALSGDGPVRFGERMRTLVGWEPVALDGADTLPVTVSVGLATGAPEEVESLVAQADAALYRAKNEGRNRVITAA